MAKKQKPCCRYYYVRNADGSLDFARPNPNIEHIGTDCGNCGTTGEIMDIEYWRCKICGSTWER